jgi:hypothetical protein
MSVTADSKYFLGTCVPKSPVLVWTPLFLDLHDV